MAHGRSPTHRRRRPQSDDPAPSAVGRMRLQKVLAAAGFGSRRSAEELIRTGRVTVNGRTAGLGDSADPATDVIALDGERIRAEKARYWMLHKPLGVVTTMKDPHGRQTVMHLLPPAAGRLQPVGRLDRDSSGLLLMTNDGELAHVLLHPAHESEKEYRVSVKGEVLEKSLAKLRRGFTLEDGRTAPARPGTPHYDADTGLTTLSLILTEGRKRQVRRMMLALGHPVKKLVRVRVGPLLLGSLPSGAARPLRSEEIRALKAHAAGRVEATPARRARKRVGRTQSTAKTTAKVDETKPRPKSGRRPGAKPRPKSGAKPRAKVRPSRRGGAAGRRKPAGSPA